MGLRSLEEEGDLFADPVDAVIDEDVQEAEAEADGLDEPAEEHGAKTRSARTFPQLPK